jgi:general nucleoside transport system permease protein
MSAPIELPKWADVSLVPILAVIVAFLIAGLVVLGIGESPVKATVLLIKGALGSGEGIGYTLYYATNFIFTGLAVAIAFHAGLFNIGGEGQATMGGLGAALVCLRLDFLPWYIVLPLAIMGAMAMGALWAFIPGYLQVKRGSHVVITTIMFNFLAATLVVYLLVNVIGKPGSMSPETRVFEASAHLPYLHEAFAFFGMTIPKSPLNLSFILALLASAFVWILVWHTRLGYSIRTVGHSPSAATYAGISIGRITMITMAMSGALAGLLAVNEILGVQGRLLLEFSSGYGFIGIAVALMGRAHPVGIILASILFGILYQGGTELSFEMPRVTRDMIVAISGLVILFAGALDGLIRRPVSGVLARLLKKGA